MTDQAEIVARWLGWTKCKHQPGAWHEGGNCIIGTTFVAPFRLAEDWKYTGQIFAKMRTEPEEVRIRFCNLLFSKVPNIDPPPALFTRDITQLTPELVLECAAEVVL